MCLKKRANFETVYKLEIVRIDFDDIWQKYSKDSRVCTFQFSCRFVFLPRDASAERGNATVSCPSVCNV